MDGEGSGRERAAKGSGQLEEGAGWQMWQETLGCATLIALCWL